VWTFKLVFESCAAIHISWRHRFPVSFRPKSVTRTGRKTDVADEQAPTAPGQVMMQMIAGFWVSRTVYGASTLGLVDLVNEGPKSADELATVTGTDGRAMYRLLRALASVGVFARAGRQGVRVNVVERYASERRARFPAIHGEVNWVCRTSAPGASSCTASRRASRRSITCSACQSSSGSARIRTAPRSSTAQ
jgi:Dimerisation domain